jgi:hypothetical protein
LPVIQYTGFGNKKLGQQATGTEEQQIKKHKK